MELQERPCQCQQPEHTTWIGEDQAAESVFLQNFWQDQLADRVRQTLANPKRPQEERQRSQRYPNLGPNEGVDEWLTMEMATQTEEEVAEETTRSREGTVVTSFPTKQSKKYNDKLKQQGGKPAQRRVKVCEEHYDDCGEDLGDLQYLLDQAEAWEEHADFEEHRWWLETSMFSMHDVTFWLGSEVWSDGVQKFDSLEEYLQTQGTRHQSELAVGVMELRQWKDGHTWMLNRHHVPGAQPQDQVMDVSEKGRDELQKMLMTVCPLVLVVSTEWAHNEEEVFYNYGAGLAEAQRAQGRDFMMTMPTKQGEVAVSRNQDWQILYGRNPAWTTHGRYETWASSEVLLARIQRRLGPEPRETLWTYGFAREVADSVAELVWLLEVDLRQAYAGGKP